MINKTRKIEQALFKLSIPALLLLILVFTFQAFGQSPGCALFLSGEHEAHELSLKSGLTPGQVVEKCATGFCRIRLKADDPSEWRMVTFSGKTIVPEPGGFYLEMNRVPGQPIPDASVEIFISFKNKEEANQFTAKLYGHAQFLIGMREMSKTLSIEFVDTNKFNNKFYSPIISRLFATPDQAVVHISDRTGIGIARIPALVETLLIKNDLRLLPAQLGIAGTQP